MALALGIFIVMYGLLLFLPNYRPYIALGAAVLFVLVGILPISHVLGAINRNVILMLAGTMMVVELFIQSQMPMLMAEKLLQMTPNVKWAVIVLSLFAGIVSAFVDNVATLLMLAPIGLSVSKKLNINPIPIIISISVSSNLQGAATLVGDTTSILLGAYAHMSFNDFFFYQGRLSIAFSTEIGALLTIPVLLFLFRKENEKVSVQVETKVMNLVPSGLLMGMVASLIFASQFENKPELTNGMICVGFALFGLLYEVLIRKKKENALLVMKAIDVKTLLLLTGLFIVIQGITDAGVITEIAKLFVKIGGHSVLLMYVLILVVSVVLSAFVDNIPYVATMLPVVQGIAMNMGIQPTLLYFGLLIGSTLGGNLTPIGATANITGIGILNRAGYEVGTKDFMKIGIPFTLVAVIGGGLFTWFIWGI
ncbi:MULTISPECIES: SLC13 family permease [Terrabacteria group]|uniref:SLC13 family permease n=1 Tax=Bacillati TaxID=1783272 RepID=UPI001C6EC29E|nr:MULTISPECIES: SLC13 family permease [Terrabacteria group]MBW9212176.1 TRAP transporter large permease subunit [Trueperella sp. zg.1013]